MMAMHDLTPGELGSGWRSDTREPRRRMEILLLTVPAEDLMSEDLGGESNHMPRPPAQVRIKISGPEISAEAEEIMAEGLEGG